MKESRHLELIQLLKQRKALSVQEIADLLHISLITVRRDLSELSDRGLVRRTHGGAMLADSPETLFADRSLERQAEKDLIGAAAAQLIRSHDVVFMDPGTTSLAVARHIPADLPCTVITTGLQAGVELTKKTMVTAILIGGTLESRSQSAGGYKTIQEIRSYRANKAFISTREVSAESGACEVLPMLVEIKQEMITHSREVILVADSSKFTYSSLGLCIPIAAFHQVVTTEAANPQHLAELTSRGLKVTVVPLK